MEDKDKTKGQLVAELAELRQRIVELETAESDHKQKEELKQYQFMVESAHDVIFFKDMKSRYIIANNRTLEAFGLSREEVIGKNDYEIMPDKKEAKKNVEDDQEVFNTGTPRKIIKHMTGANGKEYWFQAIKVPHLDTAGNITGLVGIARDITDHRQIEDSLRKEQTFIETALNAQDDIFFVFEIATGRPVRWNEYCAKISGYTDEEIASLKVPYDFFEGEDINKALITLEHVLKEGSGKVELLLLCKDGKKIPIDLSASLINNSDGNPQYIIVLGRDITERKEAEEFYRTLSEKTWTAIYVVQDGIIQLLNSRGAAYVGYTPEELIGRKSISMIHPEDRETAAKNSVAMLKGERTSPYEFRVITKDGDTRWIIETITSINYKGKRAILGNSMDITERKITEKALQQSEQRYRTLIDSTFDLIFKVDSRQIFAYINPRFEEVTGYTFTDLKGRPFTYVLAPEYREQSVTRFKRGMKGKVIPPYEADLIHKDGRRIAVEFLVITLYDTTGQPTGRFGVGRDITQRKRAENALLESEEKYHSLVSTEDFMYLIDRDCRYIFMNETYRKRYGLDLNQVSEKTYADFHSKDQAKDFYEVVAGVFETGESIQNEVKSNVDGRYYLRTMSPVKGEGGKITAVTVVSKDITKRKQAEEELERHREHLRLINQILRHDIINDLAAVKSGLRLYQNSGDEGLLDDITKKVDKSVQLIRDTKELEAFILSHKDLKFYNVKNVIKKVIENYSSIEFTIEGRGQVLADEALVSVIDNIIRNAINHGKTDRIDIMIDKQENFCEVRIADYGIGIPDKIKEKIFEEGFRYGGTGHTGLGLYIVKKAMESYGGSAHVEDNNPKGAVFVLKLRRVR